MPTPSRRSVHKVTYASIRADDRDGERGALEKRMRGLEKIAFVSALRATPDELTAAARVGDPDAKEALATIGAAIEGGTRSRTTWRALARTPAPSLVAAGRALVRSRRDARAALVADVQALVAEYKSHLRAETKAPPSPVPETHRSPDATMSRTAPAPTEGRRERAHLPRDPDVVTPYQRQTPTNPWAPAAAPAFEVVAASLRSTLGEALDWSRAVDPLRLAALTDRVLRVTGIDVATYPGLGEGDWDRVIETVLSTGEVEDWTDDLVDGFEERMRVEPIGRLHLERIDMSPVGVERGELLHSVGLAPKESVVLIHREWSSRETSFEKVVTDEFEQSTEDGVTENTELASATEVQSRHARELSVDATATGGFGFASTTVTLGYGTTSEDATAAQASRNHAVEVTRRASARTRKEHKTTFTVKESAGVEDQSVRTLSNPSETEPMRIDFHQLLRKWEVDLYRHGVRLTYDVVVPSPGIDLLENIDELRRIDHLLAQPFVFELAPGTITRTNWSALAARHTAQVEAPPPELVMLRQQMFFGNPSSDEANRNRLEAFEFELPDGYRVARAEFAAYFTLDPGGFFDVFEDPPPAVTRPDADTPNNLLGYRSDLQHLHGRGGRVGLAMALFRVRSGYATATLEGTPTSDLWRSWQHAAWASMRRAAEEQWQAKRQELIQRRSQLASSIAAWDPLSLRRMEREEVMKTTLKWIFGPAFDLLPSEVGRLYGQDGGGIARLEPSRLTPAQWAQVMGVGEFVKFLHQAIEWENVLYFVYPYFWDHARNHSLKRFLNHPDSIHRAFLRGGAARVVLTIRPGFEESFTRLVETGTLEDALESDHPYLTIAQEIQAYAATHYPGLPPVGSAEEDVAAAERGVHIGRWFEYTPISATDISVNTPLDQLR
ncbi:MAG: hypothetical protein KJZ91_19070 [Myxococcales bacterium]|nr:hypothetical protein [Myxococcales bacterium]